MNQLTIFHKENNPESQAHLEKNKEHFSNKCRMLLSCLIAGERLQFADCVHTIGDLRRRSLDLLEMGVPVQRTFIPGTRIKEYWLRAEDIKKVKERFGNI